MSCILSVIGSEAVYLAGDTCGYLPGGPNNDDTIKVKTADVDGKCYGYAATFRDSKDLLGQVGAQFDSVSNGYVSDEISLGDPEQISNWIASQIRNSHQGPYTGRFFIGGYQEDGSPVICCADSRNDYEVAARTEMRSPLQSVPIPSNSIPHDEILSKREKFWAQARGDMTSFLVDFSRWVAEQRPDICNKRIKIVRIRPNGNCRSKIFEPDS